MVVLTAERAAKGRLGAAAEAGVEAGGGGLLGLVALVDGGRLAGGELLDVLSEEVGVEGRGGWKETSYIYWLKSCDGVSFTISQILFSAFSIQWPVKSN